jgi:hypothetical protein
MKSPGPGSVYPGQNETAQALLVEPAPATLGQSQHRFSDHGMTAPRRTSRPGLAPVGSPLSNVGAPATRVAA